MKRRAVLALLAGATMPLPFAAGEPSKVFRLGMLSFTPPGPGIRALEQRLQTLGWQEGRNLQIDFVRLDETNADRSLTMAAELVGRGVDTIFAGGPELAVKLAVTATKTVPVVMIANDYDPVARGYVASLARPGGNVTGVFLQQIELTPKRLQFLAEAVPGMTRVVVLWDRFSADQFEATRAASLSLKIPLHGIECTDPPYDYERALAVAELFERSAKRSEPFRFDARAGAHQNADARNSRRLLRQGGNRGVYCCNA